jgi:SAM-dependent methyltransferase
MSSDHLQLPVSRLMDGYLATQLLCVAAKLNVADALAEGPQTADALARRTSARPDALWRVLRGLAAEGVFDELPDGRFGLNPSGACLRSDAPGSVRGLVIARGELYYAAAAGLFEAVRHGGVPFERVHGSAFFDHLAQHPDRGAAFQTAMEDRARREAADVVAAYDFAGIERLVDVGGGHGVMLAAILTATPHLHGTLFDLPPVAERAREKWDETGLPGRCDFVCGDVFETDLPRSDAYLLARIVHDWDDNAAARILRRCREAMRPGGRLLLVEAVLPERAVEAPEAIRIDLHMLTLLSGRERIAAEFERLLAAAGLRLRRIVPTRSSAGIAVIEAG